MTTQEHLLPCPMCGGTEILVKKRKTTMVECKSCGLVVFNYQDGIERDAIAHWNARATARTEENTMNKPLAYLVRGGRIFQDRAVLTKDHADKAARERNDGSTVVPLYAPAPKGGQGMKDTLELAARAMQVAGDPNFANFTTLGDSVCLELGYRPGAITAYWKPHRDDGDCARMEAALGIDVEWHPQWVLSRSNRTPAVAVRYADHGGDRNAARRQSSLVAAGIIGKARPELQPGEDSMTTMDGKTYIYRTGDAC